MEESTVHGAYRSLIGGSGMRELEQPGWAARRM